MQINNCFLRLLSSSLLLPIFLYTTYLNNLFFYLILLSIYAISFYELKILYKKKKLFLFLNFLILFFLFCLLFLRGSSVSDFYFLSWIFLIVFLSDIGGYFFGRFFKGPKLSKWSPKKTISGFAGSIFLSQFSFCFLFFFKIEIFYSLKIILLQFGLCLSAIAGDLFFSYIKRLNNLKDYSNLIPGHGGLLDRIDGMIFSIIIAYLLVFANVI